MISSNISKILRDNRFILYALTIAVSFIPTWYVFQLLFHSTLSLPGVDPVVHIVISRWILNSRSIFVPYSQFFLTVNIGYYPALWQGIIAVLYLFTSVSEIDLIRYFIFFIFLLGEFSYFILFREIFKGKPIKIFFIYFILLFNLAPILKSINDGMYGEIIVMWFLLPLFLFFFLRHKLWHSSIILVFIIGTHNLSTIMTGSVILSFIITYFLYKKLDDIKFVFKLLAISLISSLPFIYYDYYLTLINNVMKSPNGFSVIPFNQYSLYLTESTLYIGILCLIIISIFYKNIRWLPLWFCSYLILTNIPFSSSRIVREMSIPLSISIGIVLFDLANNISNGITIQLNYEEKIKKYVIPKNIKIKLIILIFLGLIFLNNGIGPIIVESNPTMRDYFTPLKAETYNWLNHHSNNTDGAVVIRCLDSWARVYLDLHVYELFPEQQLSGPDEIVNNQLNNALLNPNTLDSFSTFKRFNISYFILSNPLPGRWYPDETSLLASKLLEIDYESNPFYKLIYYNEVNNEIIKIYKVNHPSSPQLLLSMPYTKDNCIILKDNIGEERIEICLWETRFIFSNSEIFRLYSFPRIIENLFESYMIHSEVLSNYSIRTVMSFKNDSYNFTYEVISRPTKELVIVKLIASFDGNNLNKIQVGFSPISSNYTVFIPNCKPIKYDAISRYVETSCYEVIKFDNQNSIKIKHLSI